MNLKRIGVENSIPALIAVFVGIIILVAAFATTHWTIWIHWSWGAILGHFVSLTLAVILVWTLSFGFTEPVLKDDYGNRIKRSRPAAYGLCLGFVALASILFGLMIAAGTSPGGDRSESTHQIATQYSPGMSLQKRDALIGKIILVSILPALFGVRCALGPKPKS